MTSDAHPPNPEDQAYDEGSDDPSEHRRGHGDPPGRSVAGFAATTLWLRGRPLVLIRGPLDVRTASVVEAIISAAHRDTRDDVLVDVSGVSFCDCRGAAALGARRRVVVSGASPMLRRMCTMLGSRLVSGWASVPRFGARLGELPA